ncbi:MAG TPA: CYTH domain-containing protein [Gemmatimonadaceae bacterium]|jgi:adenylate cyclase class IV|nr:CYTH domain-containing protein [Gemmatimonadaceae bacterium]
MREVELKGVVDDLQERCRRVEAAGARLTFTGRLEDRRYDTEQSTLSDQDFVLRLRTYRGPTSQVAHLDWKGATQRVDGFKVRDELTTPIGDPDTLAAMLEHLGYRVTQSIDRDITQYDLHGTMIRFERYPQMDILVEVEGAPEGIEAAIRAIGLPREAFTADRLQDFVQAYERRTGRSAAICELELQGVAAVQHTKREMTQRRRIGGDAT